MTRQTVGNEERDGDLTVTGDLSVSGSVANPTFSGVASFPDGSASAPSVTNDGDTNTGLFFPAADAVAVATGGSERLRVDSAGQVIQGHTSAVSFAATVSTPISQVHGTNGNAAIGAARYSNNTSGPNFYLLKSRGTAIGSLSTVTTGDSLGGFVWSGVDSGNLARRAAGLFAGAEGTIAAGTVPGNLQMLIAASTGTLTERMRLDSNGLITGTGTSLGAWTAYTPTLGGTGWAIGDGTITGVYCQIGKIVFVRFGVSFGATSTYGASNSPTVSMPVTSRNAGHPNHLTGLRLRDVSLSKSYLAAAELPTNSTTATLALIGTNGEFGAVTSTAPFTWAVGDVINGLVCYEAA